jgi:hypothetical protein
MRDNPQKKRPDSGVFDAAKGKHCLGGTWSGLGVNSLYIGTNNGSALVASLSSLYQK